MKQYNQEIVTLSNGKRVANFSSPHSFTFEDGTVLPAVSKDEAERLKVTFIEKELTKRPGDIELSFDLSPELILEIQKWQLLWLVNDVDVVFCPLPMITAMKENGYGIEDTPFRSVRMEDRNKKLVSIHKQCI